jgi:hypothetical protein
MRTQEIQILVDNQPQMISPGLKQGEFLRNLVNLSPSDHMFLELKGDVDIPVSATDYILLTGGEAFSTSNGHSSIEDNPRLRHPVRCTFNEQRLTEAQALQHAKSTGAELKRFDPQAAPGSRLVADLDGIADEIIEDNYRLIVKPADQFIIIPPADEPHHPQTVEVTIDGRQVALTVGDYVVSTLKNKLNVPADYELEHVKNGILQPLADNETFKLHHAEEFISHVRTGSSS